MTERIPIHQLSSDTPDVPALKLFRFKNSQRPVPEQASPLPITPLPTDAPHRHSYYEILFIEEGEGFHEIDFRTFPIQGAGLHFLTPGQVHLLRFTSPCQGYILAFSEDFFSFYNPDSQRLAHFPFFRSAERQPVLPLTATDKKYFHNLLENMVADHLTTPAERIMNGKYLGILLQKSATLSLQIEENRMTGFTLPDLVVRFQELVDKQFREQHAVQYYAGQLQVSPDYLSKSVKNHLGVAAGDYLQTRLLMEAKRLLVFTPMSAKEIAYSLHMEDPSYFGRIFKRKTGLTPSEYRESVRKSAIN
ncbi:helix-turn-helix domain-containing protein [Arundinibacter roseus]|uniref:AraC family transcriptional regulator n=1 Tax=Arundinibacter roseus TaxID=2070510 RepID=A0A4R4KN38_9BACT|nr:AraC family transcriptional regulator [Arundinibacter roseus]TDB68129.1 AraC family transcriptional regulator [Arundinibacter roseus]